ncbi:DC-STAMP domain-containing protein 2 isoform X1 [Bombyx mori]|uniref:DC-STAMP domain-containing protein 2 isoform X1 n=1 Tax=Bombyx mori TaxID=7091 RepID=UPI002ED363F1
MTEPKSVLSFNITMSYFSLLFKSKKYDNGGLAGSIPNNLTQIEETTKHISFKTNFTVYMRQLCPDGTSVSNFFIHLSPQQAIPRVICNTIAGFTAGIIMTYFCYSFLVYQLSLSLFHATVISSVVGVLLTMGLGFSYRIRCLTFLLIPQMFSRAGRYTLTCYALVLILTGPAANTLRNAEVLTESMACSQEQLKMAVRYFDCFRKPSNVLRESIDQIMNRMQNITNVVVESVDKINKLMFCIVDSLRSSVSWLESEANYCNEKLGTPHRRCLEAMKKNANEYKFIDANICENLRNVQNLCDVEDSIDDSVLATIKRRMRKFSERVRVMLKTNVDLRHVYSVANNASLTASQVAAGIVTEMRNKADPLLTWLSWSSFVTSLFLLLIIIRAKYYQNMYETRSRFDNRYITKELLEIDSKRRQEGRKNVLPLHRRERDKYIATTSLRLMQSEKVNWNRSVIFMIITTFKLMIHITADYSLYWVLTLIRHHESRQTPVEESITDLGIKVFGSGFVARFLKSILDALCIPLHPPVSVPSSCLPSPHPPDFRRYMQIGFLILLLWFFALFEPYGLRLRHMIMAHYRPERAEARAMWLYNHLLRTRGTFIKFARRKLHKEHKYNKQNELTFREWLQKRVPFHFLLRILGLGSDDKRCLLCGVREYSRSSHRELIRCTTNKCPGTYCQSCYVDIGCLCTACLLPEDYGDLSDRFRRELHH